jgi:hypothetical protein
MPPIRPAFRPEMLARLETAAFDRRLAMDDRPKSRDRFRRALSCAC